MRYLFIIFLFIPSIACALLPVDENGNYPEAQCIQSTDGCSFSGGSVSEPTYVGKNLCTPSVINPTCSTGGFTVVRCVPAENTAYEWKTTQSFTKSLPGQQCSDPSTEPSTCSNGVPDGDEDGTDCGGPCSAPCIPSCPDDYEMSVITVGSDAFYECYRIVPDDGIGNCPNDYTYIEGGDCINKIPPLLSAGEVYIAPEGNPWNNADNSSLPTGLPPSPTTDTTTTYSAPTSTTTNPDGSTTVTDSTTTTNADGSTTTTTTTTTTNADGSTSTTKTTATTGPTSGASGEWQDQWERTAGTQTDIMRESGRELEEQTGILKGIADFLESAVDKLAWWEEDHPFNPGYIFPTEPVINLESETPTIAPEFMTEPDWEALETQVKDNSLVELAEDAEITLSGAYCSISSPLKIGSTNTTQTVDFCHWEEYLRKLGVIIMFFSYVCGIVYLARR